MRQVICTKPGGTARAAGEEVHTEFTHAIALACKLERFPLMSIVLTVL